jgi:CSLREA domain-containing protein
MKIFLDRSFLILLTLLSLGTVSIITWLTFPAESIVLAEIKAAFIVNSPADDDDALPGDGLCQTAGGSCTLRAAIREANAAAGLDTISFNLTLPATIPLAAPCLI